MSQDRPQAVIDMLSKLVAFDTTSRHSNMALIHFVQDYLNDHGVKSHLAPNETGDKANLYASVGPDCEGGVVLSGHTDVVPVDGQDWTSDPFRLREADGKLYGRGSADMKGFIAGALAGLPQMKKAALKKPIHFAFSYDEELGCRGAPDMIRRIAENLPKPMAVIVGEPTEMGLVNAHKGVAIFKTQITGKAAHSSQTQLGYSAIMAAGEMINKLAEINARLAEAADPNSPFLPNHTTANVNQIKGGAASNILAADCRMDWDVRIMPDDNSDDITDELKSFVEQNLLPKMRKSAPDAAIVTELLSCSPPLKPEKNSAAERLIRALTGANHADVVSYGTEAGLFQEQGFSTVVCGPGSIAQAHQPDEWIAIDELAKLDRFLNCLIAHLGK